MLERKAMEASGPCVVRREREDFYGVSYFNSCEEGVVRLGQLTF